MLITILHSLPLFFFYVHSISEPSSDKEKSNCLFSILRVAMDTNLDIFIAFNVY